MQGVCVPIIVRTEFFVVAHGVEGHVFGCVYQNLYVCMVMIMSHGHEFFEGTFQKHLPTPPPPRFPSYCDGQIKKILAGILDMIYSEPLHFDECLTFTQACCLSPHQVRMAQW